MFLTSCVTNTHEVTTRKGSVVTVAPQTFTWSELHESELERPLRFYKGTDILTEQTLRDILNNNEKLTQDASE